MTLKYDRLTLKMTSHAVENDTIELAVLKTPNTDLKVAYVALQEVTIGQELRKLGNLTLKMTFLTLKMTSNVVDNDIIELAILNNPNIDTEIVSLALLEVTLAQDSS